MYFCIRISNQALMDFFRFEITPIEIVGYTMFLLLAMLTVFPWLRRRNSIVGKVISMPLEAEAPQPTTPLSVVVIAHANDYEEVETTIPLLMSQHYGEYEVIVVNVDESELVDNALTRLSLTHPSLRTTFIPGSSSNVSKRKLAITLGVKAARYPAVVITSAHSRPGSDHWLRSFGRHFDAGADVVIGYTHPDYTTDKSQGHRYRAFDGVADASRYLAAAIHHKAFRGNGNNIAYRTSAFFEMKGFSSALNLKYGDDDIFISQLAKRYRVEAELSAESILEDHVYDYERLYRNEKEHRYFTLSHTAARITFMSVLHNAVYYLYLLCAVGGVAYPIWFYYNGGEMEKTITLASATAIVVAVATTIFICSYRRISRALSAPRLLFSLPFLYFVRPMINAYLKLKSSRAGNYTWE